MASGQIKEDHKNDLKTNLLDKPILSPTTLLASRAASGPRGSGPRGEERRRTYTARAGQRARDGTEACISTERSSGQEAAQGGKEKEEHNQDRVRGLPGLELH